MNKYVLWLLYAILSFVITSCQDFYSDEKLILEKGNMVVTIDAANAGKITSFKYKEKEILSGSNNHPLNFGSTLWPAPQQAWNWPPPEILDNQPYQVIARKSPVIVMSKKDTITTGLQFRKKYQFGDTNTFVIQYVIKNISDTTQNVAAWEVTRALGGLSFFPVDSPGIMKNTSLHDFVIKNAMVWYQFNPDNIKTGGKKMFAGAKKGWLANVNNQLLFVKEFPDLFPGTQAPNQGEIEIFATADPSYIELENHGKYAILNPSDSLVYEVRWHVAQISEDIQVRPGNPALIKEVEKLITN